MLSLGTLLARASSIAARRRGLPPGSPPPTRAATVISRRILVKILPRLASVAAFLCLMVAHLLCPDMFPLPAPRPEEQIVYRSAPRAASAAPGGGRKPLK